MPVPNDITAEQRPDLGTIAYDYALEADQRGFIADRLFPVFETPLQSAQYPVIKKEQFLKLQDTARAPRGAYSRDDYKFDFDNYACKEEGWEQPIDDVEAKLYARYFDVEVVSTRRAVDIILRKREAKMAAKVFNTGNITQTADVSIPWNTAATAVPRSNVEAGKMAMRAASGIIANVGVCSKKVFDTLMLCAEITSAFRYTNPIELGGYEAQRRLMAQYFGLDEILVAGGMKDTANKGQNASISDIWDDEYFGLFKRSGGGQDLQDPCVGRTFLWTEDAPNMLVTESYRDERIRSNVIRVRSNIDQAFIFELAGYLLGNIIHP